MRSNRQNALRLRAISPETAQSEGRGSLSKATCPLSRQRAYRGGWVGHRRFAKIVCAGVTLFAFYSLVCQRPVPTSVSSTAITRRPLCGWTCLKAAIRDETSRSLNVGCQAMISVAARSPLGTKESAMNVRYLFW